MADVIQLDDIRSPRYHDNEDREGIGTDGKDNCLICGRIVDETTMWLRMTVHGEIVMPEAEVPEAEDQGCFALGRGCLRRHPELRPFVIPVSPR